MIGYLIRCPCSGITSSAVYLVQFSSAILFTHFIQSKPWGTSKHGSTLPTCSAHSDILYPYTYSQKDPYNKNDNNLKITWKHSLRIRSSHFMKLWRNNWSFWMLLNHRYSTLPSWNTDKVTKNMKLHSFALFNKIFIAVISLSVI